MIPTQHPRPSPSRAASGPACGNAAAEGVGEEATQLEGAALVLVIEPDLFDEGLLGRRVL